MNRPHWALGLSVLVPFVGAPITFVLWTALGFRLLGYDSPSWRSFNAWAPLLIVCWCGVLHLVGWRIGAAIDRRFELDDAE